MGTRVLRRSVLRNDSGGLLVVDKANDVATVLGILKGPIPNCSIIGVSCEGFQGQLAVK